MADCENMDAFNAKFKKNMKIDGFGLDVMLHVPCPFCADPDALVHKVIDTVSAYEKGARCKGCGRGFRGIFTQHRGGTTFLIVQTAGDDPPAWLPRMPRERLN